MGEISKYNIIRGWAAKRPYCTYGVSGRLILACAFVPCSSNIRTCTALEHYQSIYIKAVRTRRCQGEDHPNSYLRDIHDVAAY